jgi:thiamine pyrophosphate-dependent acetolactate synthase large subunit-like protein
MVYAGGGVVLNNASSQSGWLGCLLASTNTLMGQEASDADPQFTGMLGMHGTYNPTWRCSTATC